MEKGEYYGNNCDNVGEDTDAVNATLDGETTAAGFVLGVLILTSAIAATTCRGLDLAFVRVIRLFGFLGHVVHKRLVLHYFLIKI